MKKTNLLILCLLLYNLVFSQWKKVAAIPARDIVAFVANENTLYAASGTNIIYKSTDGGSNWISIRVSENPIAITTMIFYEQAIYVGTFNFGIFHSEDDGITWQSLATSPPFISELATRGGILYASTLGNGVARMNASTHTWSYINNLLPDYSANVQQVIASPDFLLIAAGANGTFYRYNFITDSWNEEYYDGILHPALLINRLINCGDTLFAVNFGRIIASIDTGRHWTNDITGTHNGFNRSIYAGTDNYYTLTNLPDGGTWLQQRNRKAPIGSSWAINEEFLPDGYTYDIVEFQHKLFLGKRDGLYVKNLAPGIASFTTKCGNNKISVDWKTAEEVNSNHFEIEKSLDGIQWTVIGTVTAAGNSIAEASYSYTDTNPVQQAYYRIAEYDNEGRALYSTTLHSSCIISETFNVWPNPVHDKLFVNIMTSRSSQAVIKVFDAKGAMVDVAGQAVLQGSNQIGIDMQALAKGVYTLSVEWDHGNRKKWVRIIKQ